MYESYLKLAEKLAHLTPGDFDKKVILLNSGAEAVENTVKIARKHTGRTGVVSFVRGFHGRTNLTMSMTSKVRPYKLGFGPFASDVYQTPYPNLSKKPDNLSDEEYVDYIIQQLNDLFISAVDPDTGKPDKEKTAEIVKQANKKGLLLLSAGLKGNVIRFLTPLVITDDELNKGLEILEDVCRNV